MAFDLDQYVKNNSAKNFDLDSYVQKHNAPVDDVVDLKKPSQAFLEHYGNAATGGYLPHIQAATQKLLPNPSAKVDAQLKAKGIRINQQPPSSYVESRDDNIKRLAQQEKESPYASAMGTGTGIVAQGLMGSSLIPVAKTAGFAQKMAQAGKSGALIGGLSNPGDTEGELDPLQLENRAGNALIGAGVGMGAQGLVSGVGGAAKKASGYFARGAEEKAAKAAGFRLQDFRKADEMGTLQQTGRTLLDEGVVTAGASPTKIAERIGAKITEKDKVLGSLIDGVEEKLSNKAFWNKLAPEDKKAIIAASFRPKEQIAQIKAGIQSKYTEIPQAKLQGAFDEVESWLSEKGKVVGIRSLQEMKVQMNRFLKDSDFWRQPASFAKEGTLAVRRSLKEGIEKKADALAGVMGERAGKIKATNKTLGSLYEAEQAAQDRVTRNAANRFLSPSDYGIGALGSTVGAMSADSPEEKIKRGLIGFSVAGANKLARNYGPQVQAKVYDAIANRLGNVQSFAKAAGKNPMATQLIAQGVGGKVQGRGGFEEQKLDPEVLDYLQKHPKLLQNIADPKIRAEYQKELQRRPSQNAVERRIQSK